MTRLRFWVLGDWLADTKISRDLSLGCKRKGRKSEIICTCENKANIGGRYYDGVQNC